MIKSKKTSWLAQTALLGLVLAGCGAKGDGAADSELEGVPEQAAFQLSLTNEVESEATATKDDSVDSATDQIKSELADVASALTTNPAPELESARGAVRELNEAIRKFMQPIAALVHDTEPTTVEGNLRTWGPVTRGPTEFRFLLRHGTLRRYGWLLQARPAGSDAEFTAVAAGRIRVGFAPRRGSGTLGLDLDALGSVERTVNARGSLFAGFAHGPRGSIIDYRLRDFAGPENKGEPIDALVQRVHLLDGYNRLRLAYHGNLPESATDAPELVLSRVRHKVGVGGRADLLVMGGDVAENTIWTVSECWSAELTSIYRVVRECPAGDVDGARCQIVKSTGDLGACVPGFSSAEFAPQSPSEAMTDSESPEAAVPPPDSMPDGTPQDQ